MTLVLHRTSTCRFCGAALGRVFADLGSTPLANRNLGPEDVADERSYPLVVRLCESCLLVQIEHSVQPEAVFSKYDYFSSVSTSWTAHARCYCETMLSRFLLGPGSLVIEVGSNDGYLLRHFVALGVPVLGIEPAANVAAVAEMHGVRTEVALFGVATARKLSAVIPKAELMIANNVLAHVPDIRDFLSGFRELLSDEGVATFEFPHVLNLIEGVQFDTIYHEHIFYFSLYVLDGIMTSAGLRVFDVEELATHGGSLRLFVCHQHARHEETERPSHIRMQERARGLHRPEGYVGFSARILETKAAFLEFVRRASAGERVIAAYGAAAKGSTFLNVCGVKHPVIQAVFDRAMSKQGKLTPGSHIPILAPNQLCEIKPDYLLILPWNLKEEIIASMPELRHWGGQFVTAVPDIRLF